MRFFSAALFFFGAAVSFGQSPQVPHKMQFAGMTLTIREDARSEIQKDVDALTQHPYYFNIKVERAKTYFPIIEEIFREERLPDDFKYLALQESALISDAVSVSDAVGFWQFKDFTAEEVGMRVDREIDERMNLISSTRGAAKYLKQNNYQFNNWVYALQAYQMGAGGAKRAVGDKHNGAKHMEIDKHTYWYVKKYLAHKIAFESAVEGEPLLRVKSYQAREKTSLEKIAAEFSVDVDEIKEYNKWARAGVIPGDRPYTILIPEGTYDKNFNVLAIAAAPSKPIIVEAAAPADMKVLYINEIPVVTAMPGDQLTTIADKGGVSLSALLRYNDLSIDHKVQPGNHYFLDKKRSKAEQPYHKLVQGESLWLVSQTYGVKLKKLKKYNRIGSEAQLQPNNMLWLSSNKPPVKDQLDADAAIEVDENKVFDWGQGKSVGSVEVLEVGEGTEANINYASLVTEESSQSEQSFAIDSGNQQLETTSVVHEVKPSDTLYSVARQYGVTIKELMDWNEKRDFELSVGEQLKIARQ
ncbi:MAG: LysM peptidoglycan-binding domain-containing protein [Cyclobacteriaceae bacterium]